MSFSRYAIGLVIPLSVFLSIALGGPFSLLAFAVAFGLFPLLELVLKGNQQNLTPEQEAERMAQRRYDYLVYAMVPIQFGLLGFFLWRVSSGVTAFEGVAMTLSMGVACGVIGINVAHELGHRRRRFEQRMAQGLLLTSLYTHFFIEHNRGHHVNVATANDPATSRRGETVFRFYLRSVWGGWKDAWRLERRRLTRRGIPVISFENQMLNFQLLQAVALATVGSIFGWVGLVGYVGAAAVGALLLETVNYLEHYGLSRERNDDGRFGKVTPAHSWNSNHSLGRLMLFELTRHSDHHANAKRPYQLLRHFEESPQLPTGYPGMMLLAWCPPLWFRVMHRRLDERAGANPAGTAPGAYGSASPATHVA